MISDQQTPRRFYTIGQASRLTGVPCHSIRYWENEFSLLRPQRKTGGHRVYTADDIEKIQRIKELVYVRKMTLEGAKKELSAKKSGLAQNAGGGESSDGKLLELLREINKELCLILKE